VVLSLAIVAASVAGGQAGASTASKVSAPHSFITVTVAPGDTVWSLANRVGNGDAGQLVAEIIEINSLVNGDLTAGQKIRIPL
jgi:LysM repeat protein